MTLSPGEEVHSASQHHFLWASDGIALEQRPREGSGGWLARLFSGQGPDDVFVNKTDAFQFVALSIAQPGKVVPVELWATSRPLLVESGSYLASTGSATHEKMMLQCHATAESLSMQRIRCLGHGKCTVFMQAGGTVVEKKLRDGESVYVHTQCIVALTDGVAAHPPVRGAPVVMAGGGGVHYFNYGPVPQSSWGTKMTSACILKGPGTVYLSNLPSPRVSRHVLTARGGGADALVVVKLARLFLFLMIMGFLAAMAQMISIEHMEL